MDFRLPGNIHLAAAALIVEIGYAPFHVGGICVAVGFQLGL
jgi:hypothetical protein